MKPYKGSRKELNLKTDKTYYEILIPQNLL